jgi:hypothetical protein
VPTLPLDVTSSLRSSPGMNANPVIFFPRVGLLPHSRVSLDSLHGPPYWLSSTALFCCKITFREKWYPALPAELAAARVAHLQLRQVVEAHAVHAVEVTLALVRARHRARAV